MLFRSLIRQAPSGHASNDILGFSQMISSWSFVLLYLWMATALGLTILRTSFPLKFGRLSFLLNHIGLFIALIAATLGNADMQRLKMTTRMGNAEWRRFEESRRLPLCSDKKCRHIPKGFQYLPVCVHRLNRSMR